jgi:protein ImuB
MSRIVSAWLPRWPILRFLASQAKRPGKTLIDPERPFVLTTEIAGAPRIVATNAAAEAFTLRIGDTLADARAKAGFLQAEAADPAADEAALRRLALWATRYSPAVSLFDAASGADGFFIEIAGSAHLFGGEKALLTDLTQRLESFGLPVRPAIAATPGAAIALSRFHPRRGLVLRAGEEIRALSDLPIEALRLSEATSRTLRRLGLKRIGALIDKPRAPFAARFEAELLERLDQAIGRKPEPLAFIAPDAVYRRLQRLVEPVMTQDAVLALAAKLMSGLVEDLRRDDRGARNLRLSLYRVDGRAKIVDIGLGRPSRDATHVLRLIRLKLERGEDDVDPGFGFEAVSLAVTTAEPLRARQTELAGAAQSAEQAERCAALIDSLVQRLGAGSVRQIEPRESHLPEKAESSSEAASEAPSWPAPDTTRLRPLLFLRRPELAEEVLALVPDGPPRRFRWRGATHGVVLAQGPERIAGEWWRHGKEPPTRDYYLVENERGRRLWMYREGLYERETASPRWFVQGFFS